MFGQFGYKRFGDMDKVYLTGGCLKPHGHVSLKMQNIESVFDVTVLGDFKRRKFDGRMDLTSNCKMYLTSNKLGRFIF